MLPAVCLARTTVTPRKSQPLPQVGEFVRFADPTTETPVVRLTTPAYADVLPASGNRFVLLKPRVLYCSSDRTGGRMMPFQIDLRTGAVRQIAETAALDANSLTLDAGGRELYLIDGQTLCRLPVSGKHEVRRPEVVAEGVSAFGIGASRAELFAIRGGQLQPAGEKSAPAVLAEDAHGPCLVRPGGAGCLFTRPRAAAENEREFWYAAVAAPGKPLLLAGGRISNPCWSADGASLLFLRDVPKNNVFLAEVRAVVPGQAGERCLSPTSQFAVFGANPNDSMLVGASRSKAQPNVVLLLPSLQRELTLCEHHATAAAEVRPAFSPDSRRVYFQSDREGKPAIYSVNVELLVEPT